MNALYERQFRVSQALDSKWLGYWQCHECDLRFFCPAETGDEDLYSLLQEFDWYYMDHKWEYQFAKDRLSPEEAVLEVGAGRAAFAKLLEPDRYRGLELSDAAIRAASAGGVELIKQSIEDHASGGHAYDAVVSFQVLEHVRDPASFLSSCVDCLKPNGKLILAVPAQDGFLGRSINNALNMPPHHVTHWTAVTLEKIAPLFRLDLQEVVREPLARYHLAFARRIVLEARIRHLLLLKQRLLDMGSLSRWVGKAAALLARVVPVNSSRLAGHTIAAVYTRPAAQHVPPR